MELEIENQSMTPLILDSVLNVDATGLAIGECPFTLVIWIFAIRNALERLLCSGERKRALAAFPSTSAISARFTIPTFMHKRPD